MSKRPACNSKFAYGDLPLPNDKALRVRMFNSKGWDYLELKIWEPDRLRGMRPDSSHPIVLPLVMVGSLVTFLQSKVDGRLAK